MPNRSLVALPLVLLLLLSACGSEPEGDSGDKADLSIPERAALLHAEPSGLVELRDADTGVALFALAPTGLVARTFKATPSGVGAIAVAHEQITPTILAPASAEVLDAGARVKLTYAGGDQSAVLEAQVVDGHKTRFTLTTSGPAPDAKLAHSLAVPIRCDAEGTFHGFGEQYNTVDQRGEAFDLLVNEQGNGRDGSGGISVGDEHTTYFPMPWYIDARGWGVLFDTERRVRLDLCKGDGKVAWVEVIGETKLTWQVFHGPTPLGVIGQLGEVVGRPKAPPKWAWWLWIGTQGGRDKVLAEAKALADADIPTAALWAQDWGGIRKNIDGGFGVEYVWKPDEALVSDPKDAIYPGFKAMVDQLHGDGFKFLAYANPFIPKQVQPKRFEEMAAKGLLVKNADGSVYEDSLVPNLPQTDGHPDFGHPDTAGYIAGELGKIISDYGVDGWMLDFGEWVPLDGAHHDGSDPVARRNTFPVDWNRSCRMAAEKHRPDNDFAWIARSGWTGVQRHAQIHWVGDQETNWDHLDGLPTVVPAMLNLGLSGQPFATHDIAGFAKGTPTDKELWMRWTELGAFTPVMRTHEGADKLANWSWEKDPETTAHFRRFTLVHCALKPTFEKLAAVAEKTSAPLLRAMFLVFPDDKQTWALSDQYMIGDTLLVAPVLAQGALTRKLYLPAGDWYDVWTGTKVAGGRFVEVDAPLGSPPVFSRGADLPTLRKAESTLSYADCR